MRYYIYFYLILFAFVSVSADIVIDSQVSGNADIVIDSQVSENTDIVIDSQVSEENSEFVERKSSAVLLQGFHWESHMQNWWNVIANKAAEIADSGFDYVWLPPSSIAASDEGYLPNRLYHQESQYGSSTQLKSAINALHRYNVRALADIVINHRVGTFDWGDFTEPEWGPDSVCCDDEWPKAAGNPDTGQGYGAARDIDHTKMYVRNSIIEWLNWLKASIGYDGWRYDYTKGFGGKYVGLYNDATKPCFSVGEFWDNLNLDNPNPHRQQLCNWLDATGGKSATFDFTTKGMLQQAVAYNQYWRMKDKEGKPVGLIGWWPSKAVTFLDNHDTGPSTGGNGGQNHWPFPSKEIMQGYAYILTHPGIPTVYWVHFFDWGLKNEIKTLIRLRKSVGLHSESKVSIQAADTSKYAAIIDDKVAVKIGAGSWNPGNGWSLYASGTNYSVWTK